MNTALNPSNDVPPFTGTTSAAHQIIPTLLFGSDTLQPPEPSVEIVQSLTRRTDLDLIAYTRTVLKALTGNEDFPLLQSVLPLALEQVDRLAQDIIQIGIIEAQLSQLHTQKTQSRRTLETTFRTLGLLVQAESRNNPAKINSVGIRIKGRGVPNNTLPSPRDLAIDPGPNTGTLEVRWKSVRRCKGYILRLALATPGPREWIIQRVTGKPRFSFSGLQAGATYVGQVASLGSAKGQSPWSPEVSRVCA